ncbi:hypothetical protein D9M68_816300 [compost metagenome]
MPIFVIGRSFYLIWSRQVGLATGLALAASAAVGFASLQLIIYPESARELASTYPIAVLLFVAGMMLRQKPHAIVNFFGDLSYGLYLLHMPVGMLTMNTLYAMHLSLSVCILGAWTASVLAAWIATKFVANPIASALRARGGWGANGGNRRNRIQH